jgi:hypothetical protein
VEKEPLLLFSEVKVISVGKEALLLFSEMKVISVGKETLVLFSEVKVISVEKEPLLLFSEVRNYFSGKRTSAVALRGENNFWLLFKPEKQRRPCSYVLLLLALW